MKYRLGTRKSLLAQAQSQWVCDRLEKVGVYCDLVMIESEGDQNRLVPLYEIDAESPGLFTKQLEDALLQNRIDLAVHSLKDLPTTQPPELIVASVPIRGAVNDCLLIHESNFVDQEVLHLSKGARVGTSSLRREALLLSQRSDLKIVPIRGNIPTRIRQVESRAFDAVVLASAGLDRLKFELKAIRRVDLPISPFVPAPGQGAIAVEIRKGGDARLLDGLRQINDVLAESETRMERAILNGLFGGCTLPLGVRCKVEKHQFSCRAFIGLSADRKDAKHEWRGFHHFDISDASEQRLVERAIEHLKGTLNG